MASISNHKPKTVIKGKAVKRGITSQTSPLGTVAPDEFGFQLQYQKTDVTSFLLPLADVPTHLNGVAALQRVYDVLWAMPGYDMVSNMGVQASVGAVCDIGQTHVKFKNQSPETLYLRLQRPMGYRDSPSSLAMWEPCRKNEVVVPVKPHTQPVFVMNNNSTSHMVPRQVSVAGKNCIDLFSFSVTKEPVSDTGVSIVTDNATAFEVEVMVHYKTSDAAIGETENFSVTVYENTKVMDQINSGPPPNVRTADLRSVNGFVKATYLFATSNNVSCGFLDTAGKSVAQAYGLDQDVIYEYPVRVTNAKDGAGLLPVLAYNSGARFSANDQDQWLLGFLSVKTSNPLVWTVVAASPGGSLTSYMPPNALFRPVALASSMVQGKKNECSSHVSVLGSQRARFPFRAGKPFGVVRAIQHPSRLHEDLYGDDFSTHVLETLTTIKKIIKVGIEIAGFIGLFAAPLPKGAKTVRVPSTLRSVDSFECLSAEHEGEASASGPS